jgi:4-carboxymuconolactone decarboxylase
MTDDRSTRGTETLKQIHAEWGMPNVLSQLDDIAPDLKDMVRDFAFGDVYSRPGLDLKSRQLATVAVLAALQHSPLELKAHLHGALKLGWTKQELVEVLIQIVLYAGFPAAIHGVMAAKEVFAEYDARQDAAKK